MFTQCPHCQSAFRITAEVLQQARGQVLCGSCHNAFNALDHLSEAPPPVTQDAAPPTPSNPAGQQALDTLDQLTGREDVRIEDTGIEWLVVDDEDADTQDDDSSTSDTGSMRWVLEEPDAPEEVPRVSDEVSSDVDLETADTTENPVLDVQQAEPNTADEPRYDDNTPLPDDFEEQHDYQPLPEHPHRREDDLQLFEAAELTESQSELDLSEPGDWTELLDEVDDPTRAADESQATDLAEPTGESQDADSQVDATASEPDDELRLDDDDLEIELDDSAAQSEDAAFSSEESEESEASREESDVDAVIETIDIVSPDAQMSTEDQGDVADVLLELESAIETGDAPPPPSEPGAESSGDDLNQDVDAEDDDIAPVVIDAREDAADAPQPTEQPVEYDESTGEFERAIADAESAMHSEQQEATDAAPEPEAGAQSDEQLSADIAAMTGNMQIDPEVLKAMQAGDLDALGEGGSGIVETIVMEGDAVRAMLDDADAAASESADEEGDPEKLFDTYMMSRQADDKAAFFSGRRALIGASVLGVLLLGQVVHQSRDVLAKSEFFNRTLGPIYRSLGNPLTPTYDVKGWQFETTSGATDNDETVLSITSRIANRSEVDMPYPLVHVSLTDRYEEIIGSRMLEPTEYLRDPDDASQLVAAGASFSANIEIDSPSPDATGFKLNVCYRVDPGRVRCAVEDFKEP